MRRVLHFLAVFGLLAASACGDSSTDLKPVTDAAGYSVELIDEGEEPRVTLRVATEPGTSQPVRMVIDQSQEISGNGTNQAIEVSQTMDTTYTVSKVNDEVITVDTKFDDMVVDTGTATPVALEEAIVNAFVGTTATTEITDRGSIVSLDLPQISLDEVPGVPAATLNQVIDQLFTSLEDSTDGLSIPTPVEPVGRGASWAASTESTIAGIPVQMETTITITEVTEDSVVGGLEQTIDLVKGDIEMFGIAVSVEGGEMKSSGTITYLLDGGIMPLMDMDTEGTMTMKAQGITIDQAISMRQTTTAR